MKEMQIAELINHRKYFHQHPEVSGKEKKTARQIGTLLSECNFTSYYSHVGGHGLVYIFDSGNEGKTILIRGDIDALPIQEINSFGHKSLYPNISHKCGHDGHTTILIGLAQSLSNHPIKAGKVILLFQPSEENGQGAQAVFNDHRFKKLNPDFVFALHNIPGVQKHQILVKEGSFSASVKSLAVVLNGKTAHAAEPENGINPALAIAEILLELDKIINSDVHSEAFQLITPIHINMGEKAYGISAGQGELHFTLRTWHENQMELFSTSALQIIDAITKKHALKSEINWLEVFQSNQNHPEAVNYIRMAAKENNLELVEMEAPNKWGEDFGIFTQQYKGAMFGLGAGVDTPALHNPDYDFPDEILETGIKMFRSIIQKAIEK